MLIARIIQSGFISFLICSSLAAAETGSVPDDHGVYQKPNIPPAECLAWVGYDRNDFLSGYLLPSAFGPETCVPFASTAAKLPDDYAGADFYVEEFSDTRLRQLWAECKQDAVCFGRLSEHINRRQPPNREHFQTDPKNIWLLGLIDEENPRVDLSTIRRPEFFGQDPWFENIAAAEADAFTVEFTVPSEPYERIEMGRTEDVKLRGWYLRGNGIATDDGKQVRALLVMSNGGGGRIAAIQHPSDRLYDLDPVTGKSVTHTYPAGSTGASGQRDWRQFLFELHAAGFDVMSYDRRGVGVSGGFSDTNTLQQGRDILTVIQSLRNGVGIRLLTPAGTELEGKAAAGALMGEVKAEGIPVILVGSSRGTMATGWAMTRNFHQSCDYDLIDMPCVPAVGLTNIKAAMALAGFISGVGYITSPTNQEDRDRGLFIGGSAMEKHLVFFPSSAILAGVHTWPAIFIGRGLWDYAESLEGSMDVYNRVDGLKELVVVRGPHPFETWPEIERQHVSARMIEFARAVVLNRDSIPGVRSWSDMKELVATSADVWEVSSFPSRSAPSTEKAGTP